MLLLKVYQRFAVPLVVRNLTTTAIPGLFGTHSSSRRSLPVSAGKFFVPSLSLSNVRYSSHSSSTRQNPYFLAYEGSLTPDLTFAKTVFLTCSAGIALLLGYAYEVQRVGIPFGQRRSISSQFAIGVLDGHTVLAIVGSVYALIAVFFFFLLRRYVTRVYLYRGGSTARFLALRETLSPFNDKIRVEFGLEDVVVRSGSPIGKGRTFVNAVIAGKPLFIDPNGFTSVADEDSEDRKRALQLAKMFKDGA